MGSDTSLLTSPVFGNLDEVCLQFFYYPTELTGELNVSLHYDSGTGEDTVLWRKSFTNNVTSTEWEEVHMPVRDVNGSFQVVVSANLQLNGSLSVDDIVLQPYKGSTCEGM